MHHGEQVIHQLVEREEVDGVTFGSALFPLRRLLATCMLARRRIRFSSSAVHIGVADLSLHGVLREHRANGPFDMRLALRSTRHHSFVQAERLQRFQELALVLCTSIDPEPLRDGDTRQPRPVLVLGPGAPQQRKHGAGVRPVYGDLEGERGAGYSYYVETSAAMPALIGTHWFQWVDQPNTGRFDGENYNIGLVDVTDRPYAGMIEALRRTHKRLRSIHAGQEKPTERQPIIQ